MTTRWLPIFAALLALLAAAPMLRAAASPEELLKEAQQAESSGGVQKAAGLYEQFLKTYGDHSQAVEANYRLAKCYDGLGLVDEAVARFSAVVQPANKQFRGRGEALASLARLYAAVKKNDQAVAAYEKLLGEGAGLYEDEALNQCAFLYALQGKYEDAAAKYNILRRKGDKAAAEGAAYKLAVLWLKAEKMDNALSAIQDLAQQFPQSKQLPDLLLRAADAYRQQKKFDKTISLCEQLKANFPKTPEAAAGAYLLGLCYRDRKDYPKAAEALEQVGRTREFQARGLASEGMLAAADLYFTQLNDVPKAMLRYEEAAKLARDSEGERKGGVLEQCYFRLAEQAFKEKKYAVALDYYALLKGLNTQINVLGRIIACQSALDQTNASVPPQALGDADVKALQARIEASPGTPAAAEAEVFLLDRRLADAQRRKAPAPALGEEYAKLLAKYAPEVLAQDHLAAYACAQQGVCFAQGDTRELLARAVAAFERVASVDPSDDNPYAQNALENLALVAERLGDKKKSLDAYGKLLARSQKDLDAHKDDKAAERKAMEYMKSLITRSDTADLVDRSIELTRKTIEARGPLSDLSREARYYLAELYYLKKDFSQAAKGFREFVSIYGPKQDPAGDAAGGPWKPKVVDEKAQQVYEAAVRVAHSWFMQGHDQNMVKAYQWIVKNLPHQNKWLAEAQYWLAMELSKRERAGEKENKKKLAETLWTTVVNPSLDWTDPKFAKGFYFWVSDDDRYGEVQKYVKTAILRAGQAFGEVGDHESAAAVFQSYLALYPSERIKEGKRGGGRGDVRTVASRDEMYDTARYALGREYAALGNAPKLVETYRVYLAGHRDDRFRVSALKLLAFHAGKAEQYDQAVEAYAALLDEYGPRAADAKGNPVPVPVKERLRQANTNWDGLRLPPPKDLDQGEIRFSLGYLYWKREEWGRCVRALTPFLDDAATKASPARPKALYMAGQSCYRLYDYASGVKILSALLREHPKFEAIEEVYVYAARGYYETKNWTDLDLACRAFVSEWPKSDRRARIDLYAALSLVGQGKADKGMAALKSLGSADTFEDVKADANYHYALNLLRTNPQKPEEAMAYFDKSLAFPRETSCLEAARCAAKLKKWDRAMELLDRVKRDFPQGDPKVLAEARDMTPEVQKQSAKQK